MMIGPLTQRQIHLVSTVEGSRQAGDVGEQQGRELNRKQAADDRLAEARNEVPLIGPANSLKTEQRQGRPKPSGHRHAPGRGQGEAAPEPDGPEEAEVADGHLDFLA